MIKDNLQLKVFYDHY